MLLVISSHILITFSGVSEVFISKYLESTSSITVYIILWMSSVHVVQQTIINHTYLEGTMPLDKGFIVFSFICGMLDVLIPIPSTHKTSSENMRVYVTRTRNATYTHIDEGSFFCKTKFN